MAAMEAIFDIGRNDFSNSESLYRTNASHQVSAQSDLWFERRCGGGHLGYRNETILAILNLCITVMLLIKFWPNPTAWELSFLEFQDGRHLGYRNVTILSILNLCVTVMPPIQFQLNRTYGLEGDVF